MNTNTKNESERYHQLMSEMNSIYSTLDAYCHPVMGIVFNEDKAREAITILYCRSLIASWWGRFPECEEAFFLDWFSFENMVERLLWNVTNTK